MPMALGLGLGLPYLGAACGPYPALDLNFIAMAASGVLDPRITFSRGGLATLTDAAGNVAYAPHNLFLWSNDLSNADWQKVGATTTANAGVDPLGGNTATRVQFNAGDNFVYKANGAPAAGTFYTIACWVKSNTGTAQTFRLFGEGTAARSSDFTATTSWQQFNFSRTAGGGTSIGLNTGSGGAAADLLVCFAQLNVGPLQPYYPTTSSAYHGPRFTYDATTHAALGLLIEEQRSNLFLWSRDFSNAAWTKQASGCTSVLNAAGVDGVAASASTITEAALSVPRSIYRAVSGAAGAFSQSVSFKQTTGPTRYLRLVIASSANDFGYVTVNMTTGAVAQAAGVKGTATSASAVVTSQPATGMWRVSLSCTLAAAPTIAFFVPLDATPTVVVGDYGRDQYVGDGTTNWVLDAAQFEAGAFATSYIPTTSATVTRAADSATMTGTNFSSWFNASAGTFVADVRSAGITDAQRGIVAASDGTTSNRAAIYFGAGSTDLVGRISIGGTGYFPATMTGAAGAGARRFAITYSSGRGQIAAGGAVGSAPSSPSGTLSAATQLDIGQVPGGGTQACVPIARIRFYSTPFTDAQLIAATT